MREDNMEEGSLNRGLIEGEEKEKFCARFWKESKALWKIAGPAIFSRLATSAFTLTTHHFVAHLGNLESAAFSMVTALLLPFTQGLLMGIGTALGTLCGQAYGAHQEHMLGIYMQRSWIVLIGFAIIVLPIYIFSTPILISFGQPNDVAKLSTKISLWCIPMHFAFVFYYTLNRFLQSQSWNIITAWSSTLGVIFNIISCWLLVSKWNMGLDGALMSLNLAWWIPVIIQYIYVTYGWCPNAWKGYSMEAFESIWPFLKLSIASGVMLCLEIWYYKILFLITVNMENIEVTISSLSICLNINSWEMAIPLAFLASTSVRVANELEARRPKGAKFSIIVSIITSTIIGISLLVFILTLHSKFSKLFIDSVDIQNNIYKLAMLLAFAVLLSSVQSTLIGVVVGLGWQVIVAYINITCYYIIGVPFGILLGYIFHLQATGIWLGMICGTIFQTLALVFITWKVDWNMEVKTIASK